MSAYDFTVRLDRVPDDDGQNRLDDAGLDDASLEISADGCAWMVVTRAADTLDEAITSAVDNSRR